MLLHSHYVYYDYYLVIWFGGSEYDKIGKWWATLLVRTTFSLASRDHDLFKI
jgi:hypothetical protein